MEGREATPVTKTRCNRQKLALEGSKPDFWVKFIASRYANSFCFHNSFRRKSYTLSQKSSAVSNASRKVKFGAIRKSVVWNASQKKRTNPFCPQHSFQCAVFSYSTKRYYLSRKYPTKPALFNKQNHRKGVFRAPLISPF